MLRYAGLVRTCVRPYLRSPEPSEDLLQVGYVGLLKAISNFDDRLGISQMHVSRLLERALAYLRGQITGSVETT